MKPSDHDIMVERVRQTFDLFDAGVSMMLARFRREHPDADEAEIERLLRSWLSIAPGATHGDGPAMSRTPDEAST